MNRREDCPHRPPCPGCPRFGASGLPEQAGSRLLEIAKSAGPDDPAEPKTFSIDTRGDGDIDVIWFDWDRDGRVDASLWDLDGDGTADQQGVHTSGEIEPDRYVLIE